jgi:hypothetical protein
MERNLDEHQRMQNIQEAYFADLLELGRFFQNSGQPQKAIDLIKKGIENAEEAKTDYWGIMIGLLD